MKKAYSKVPISDTASNENGCTFLGRCCLSTHFKRDQ